MSRRRAPRRARRKTPSGPETSRTPHEGPTVPRGGRLSDTIVAIATPPGAGAIGIVRISGPSAVEVVAPLVRLTRDDLRTAPSHALRRARAIDPATGAAVDDVLCVVMRAPRSYTGEDVVELSCHGSPVVLRCIVESLTAAGARLAEPGEFTRRAFLNGRIDLAQAEAVALLIEARTRTAATWAARAVGGGLSHTVRRLREQLLEIVAGLEVALDFPDDAVGLSADDAISQMDEVRAGIERLCRAAHDGRLLREGAAITLIGNTNAGKSSLLNALLEKERAIVAATPGTTRDTIEEPFTLSGVAIRLVDTAGIGQSSDPIEDEGMKRSLDAAANSDLVLLIIDGTRGDEPPVFAANDIIAVVNKADLPEHAAHATREALRVSARTGLGLGALVRKLEEWVAARLDTDAEEGGVIATLRQIQVLEGARDAVIAGVEVLKDGGPLEASLVDLRAALRLTGEVTGTEVTDEVLARIFSTFCVGK